MWLSGIVYAQCSLVYIAVAESYKADHDSETEYMGGGMSGCGVQPCIENNLALYSIFVETRLPAYSSSHFLHLGMVPSCSWRDCTASVFD